MYSSSSSSRRRRRRRRLGGPGGEVTVPPPCPCVASRCSSRPSRAEDGVAAAVFRATSLDLGANARIVRTRVRADLASFYCILLLIKKLAFAVRSPLFSRLCPRPPPPPRGRSGGAGPARQIPAPPKPLGAPPPPSGLRAPAPPPRPHPTGCCSGSSAQKQQPRRRQLRAPPLPRPAGCLGPAVSVRRPATEGSALCVGGGLGAAVRTPGVLRPASPGVPSGTSPPRGRIRALLPPLPCSTAAAAPEYQGSARQQDLEMSLRHPSPGQGSCRRFQELNPTKERVRSITS
ncbi:wiskott-Aldrich syndrome protein family member 1-like [Sciurus carolinensis]|uniref:wiskott-Aldrich syndrome protein family member 1-like n=1 Tax=Sciurus carolinensis TaxID=30640 RepID=UPI001FB455BA|nr:wiskott-Aldrich syndrome protein family member 1-like [Sciurus carolinensis]